MCAILSRNSIGQKLLRSMAGACHRTNRGEERQCKRGENIPCKCHCQKEISKNWDSSVRQSLSPNSGVRCVGRSVENQRLCIDSESISLAAEEGFLHVSYKSF